MKIAVLHGAILNAGDFLIAERSVSLLQHFFGGGQITKYYRNQDLSCYLDELNSNDVLIIAGGPGYVNGFYPDLMPLCGSLDNIKIPIMIMGMGWSGLSASPIFMYNYKFHEPMIRLLKRAVNDTGILGCRDYYSANILRNNGFDNVSVTGCPAWYDLNYINQTDYAGPKLTECRNICISDCAYTGNFKQLAEIILFVKKFFSGSNVKLIFHRGIHHLTSEFIEFIQNNKVNYIDISGAMEGFKVYDDCDLHIGFRVHAHIYNLSRRTLSVLIEEDARGAGVNSALGLERIPANIDMIQDNSLVEVANQNVLLQLEDYIFNMCSNNYMYFNSAFKIMHEHFLIMENHIKSIGKFTEFSPDNQTFFKTPQ